MSDTALQIAKQRVSELRRRILAQESVVANLRREGGDRLESESAILSSLKEELDLQQENLDRLIFHAR
jgi:hypothetical protein